MVDFLNFFLIKKEAHTYSNTILKYDMQNNMNNNIHVCKNGFEATLRSIPPTLE